MISIAYEIDSNGNKFDVLPTGEPRVALAQFDPLEITRMSIKQGGQSPVNVEINFNDVRLHGLRHFTLNSLS